jgi:transposase
VETLRGLERRFEIVDRQIVCSGRHFSASLGLVPRQDGTGGKVRLGPISKRDNGYLRRLLVSAAAIGKRLGEQVRPLCAGGAKSLARAIRWRIAGANLARA